MPDSSFASPIDPFLRTFSRERMPVTYDILTSAKRQLTEIGVDPLHIWVHSDTSDYRVDLTVVGVRPGTLGWLVLPMKIGAEGLIDLYAGDMFRLAVYSGPLGIMRIELGDPGLNTARAARVEVGAEVVSVPSALLNELLTATILSARHEVPVTPADEVATEPPPPAPPGASPGGIARRMQQGR